MVRGWRPVLLLVALAAAYLIGFVPTQLKLRDETTLRVVSQHALNATKLVKDLGSAAIDARRGEYDAARQEASAFFTQATFEIDQRDKSSLTQPQRDALAPLLGARDELITLLARGQPASADQLSTLYVAVRKALGI
jgi:hypothetical protein